MSAIPPTTADSILASESAKAREAAVLKAFFTWWDNEGSKYPQKSSMSAALMAWKGALAAFPAGTVAVPKGWKLVPEEPTPEMCKAADEADSEYSLRNFGPGVRALLGGYDHYCAMVEVAPEYVPTGLSLPSAAPAPAPQQHKGLAALFAPEFSQELAALHRFAETCDDRQEYDVSKAMMKTLAAVGLVQHKGSGVYHLTTLGAAVLADARVGS